ncbi:MAG: hypothetical protein ABUT20_59990, partial [Bacteroidota bacterium]
MEPYSNTTTEIAAPVSQEERIAIIDSLRGIALLGILLMNIPFFALPESVADNINGKVWYIINCFFDGTQRAIFSMLFGAGVILFITRLEKRVDGMRTAEYFLRRQLWLLVFGLFDAFVLLWSGDILFEYAICGIILFVFRRLPARKLLIAAAVSLLFMMTRDNIHLFREKNVIVKGQAIAAIDTSKVKLSEQQKEDLAAYTSFKDGATTESLRKEMEKDLRQIRGNYSNLYQNISEVSARIEFVASYYYIWDI